MSTPSTTVSLEQARRIAVRVQALDGSVDTVLDCVRRLGRLRRARFLGVRDIQWR